MNLGVLFALAAVLVAVCWVLDRVLTYREVRDETESFRRFVERFLGVGVEALVRRLNTDEAEGIAQGFGMPPPRGCALPYCDGACRAPPRSERYTGGAEPPGTTS